jgi:outer membrane protein
MRATWRVVTTLLSAYLLAPQVSADEMAPPARAERPLVLGAGVIYREKTYEDYSDSDKIQPVPLVIWENDTFFVRGGSAGWKAWTNEAWEIAVLAEFRGDGYDSGDADILDGMDDRDKTVDGGARVAWRSGRWGVAATWVHDLASKHEGYEARGEVSYTFTPGDGNWAIKPSASVVYQSDDLVDYYYGVQLDEIDLTLSRPAYFADDEMIYRLQTAVSWNPAGTKWEILAGVRVDFQGDEFDNSPITDDDVFYMGVLAAGYRF